MLLPLQKKTTYGALIRPIFLAVASSAALLASCGGSGGKLLLAQLPAAKSELVQIAAQQEKIYLNSDAYSSSITSAYTGASTGGLGFTTGKTGSGKYTLSIVTAAQTYTVTATPVSGTVQATDGNLTVASDGSRTWGSTTW